MMRNELRVTIWHNDKKYGQCYDLDRVVPPNLCEPLHTCREVEEAMLFSNMLAGSREHQKRREEREAFVKYLSTKIAEQLTRYIEKDDTVNGY